MSQVSYEYPQLDNWYPACSGLEVPFTFNGKQWLYVYNPVQHKHGYLDISADIVYADTDFQDMWTNK